MHAYQPWTRAEDELLLELCKQHTQVGVWGLCRCPAADSQRLAENGYASAVLAMGDAQLDLPAYCPQQQPSYLST